jgi:hypothetical protein
MKIIFFLQAKKDKNLSILQADKTQP